MRVQLLSDLHFEFFAAGDPHGKLAPLVRPDADVLVLAGDIDTLAAPACAPFGAPVAAANLRLPVVQIAGNHEWYGRAIAPSRPDVPAHVRWLENSSTVIDGVRFLGCTLWTDYKLFGAREDAMARATRGLRDHERIRLPSGIAFRAVHAEEFHQASRAWLEAELSKPWPGATVVVTHHAPHLNSVAERYRDDPLTPAFASDLTPLIERADLWIHGHMHNSSDYRIGRCRVVCNPRGYRSRRNDVGAPPFENEQFDPGFVVEVPNNRPLLDAADGGQ